MTSYKENHNHDGDEACLLSTITPELEVLNSNDSHKLSSVNSSDLNSFRAKISKIVFQSKRNEKISRFLEALQASMWGKITKITDLENSTNNTP